MTRSLIEQWLPAAAVGAESMRERATFTALPPPFALHVWWARRPLVASRAAVLASVLPAWPDEDDPSQSDLRARLEVEFPGGVSEYRAWFLTLVGILGDPVAGKAAINAANEAGVRLKGNGYGYPRAFSVNPSDADLARLARVLGLPLTEVQVLDPFAGGGSIPLEASRLGLGAFANELNPVAGAVLEGTLAVPRQCGPQLMEKIRAYGKRWQGLVKAELANLYPQNEGEGVVGYVWAHAVPCPTTGLPSPLAPDMWLSRGQVAVRITAIADSGTLDLEVVEGDDAAAVGPGATYKRGVGTSVWTGETISAAYIQEAARLGQLGSVLLAVAHTTPGKVGRRFRSPLPADLLGVERAARFLADRRPRWEVEDLIPSEDVPPGWKTDEPRRMGILRWSDMFTDRQLAANVTALEKLHQVVHEAIAELGPSEGRAIGLMLALALDKGIAHNSRLSNWDAGRLKIRNTFDRHDYAFSWSFAEMDVAHAMIPWVVDQVSKVYSGISKMMGSSEEHLFTTPVASQVEITRGSAAKLPLPTASVSTVVTDPPYYDNVMYAEVSDYFYVWLKRSLRDTWPQFTDLVLTDKVEEAVANPALFKDVAAPPRRGRRRNADDGPTASELADARYEELLKASFAEAHRVLKDDGVLTVMFTHKRVEAWDTLGAALLDAGFSITASWPVHTESEHSLHQARKNSAASTIFLACRKRTGSEPGYWSDIRADVERAADEAAHRFASEGMTGVDLTIATYGPVLSVLSDRWPVYTGDLGPDGQPEVLRPDAALDLAREKVAALKMRGLLGGRTVEFDRTTDWWLLAWSDFQAAEFPFDEARKLSIAMHLDVDDIAKGHKIVKQAAGSVTLLSPAQRRTAGAIDPEATSHDIWLDRLHALMLIYDEDGLKAAKSWLNRTGLADDTRMRDLVQAALNAVPRVQKNGEFVRPEAKTLDSLRAALFEDIPVPAAVGAGPQQLGLDEDEEGDD